MAEVRLTKYDIAAIVEEAQSIFGSRLARVRLYGSRADLAKKGGDIDVVTEIFGAVADKFAVSQTFRRGICSRLGDQKIDILIISVDSSLNTDRENTFLAVIQGGRKILWSVNG